MSSQKGSAGVGPKFHQLVLELGQPRPSGAAAWSVIGESEPTLHVDPLPGVPTLRSGRRLRETCAPVCLPEMLKADRRAEYLRENRDNSWLLDLDSNQRDRGRGGSSSRQDEVSLERQEYLERREKLKELERLKVKSRYGIYGSVSGDTEHAAGEKTKSSSSGYGDFTKVQPQRQSQLQTKPREEQPKKHLPFNNFGSFFGPSQPVVSRRIIEETRAREEAARIARIEGRGREVDRRMPVSKPVSRPIVKPSKPVNEATKKALALKEARDYSFLFSDEPMNGTKVKKPVDDAPGPAARPGLKVPVARSQATAQVLTSSRAPTPLQVVRKKSLGGGEKSGVQSSSRPLTQRKELGGQRPQGQGPSSSRPVSRPSAPVRQPPVTTRPKEGAGVGPRPTSTGGGARPGSLSKQPVSAARPTHQNVGPVTRPGGGRIGDTGMKAKVDTVTRRPPAQDARRMPVTDPRRPAPAPSRVPGRSAIEMERRPQSKPVSRMEAPRRKEEYKRSRSPDEYSDSFIDDGEDEGDVSSMIQKMFGYNPRKYRDLDEEDDRDMEVGFSRIQAEERRSAKLAREEDEIELQRIEAEEKAERLRREKKRRKL